MEFTSDSSKEVFDEWDEVVNFEGRMFENGVNEGRSDAIESGEMLENGIQAGFLKGTTVCKACLVEVFTVDLIDRLTVALCQTMTVIVVL